MNQTVIINKIKKSLNLIICYILLFIKRLPITYISDDAVNIGNDIVNLPLPQIIKTYYYGKSGKFFCDSLMYLTYKCPLILWKIIDPIIWVLIIVLIVKLFTKQKLHDYLMVSIFALLFPYYYLDSAGYIASSYNYVYTTFSLLVILYCLKKIIFCLSNIYIYIYR